MIIHRTIHLCLEEVEKLVLGVTSVDVGAVAMWWNIYTCWRIVAGFSRRVGYGGCGGKRRAAESLCETVGATGCPTVGVSTHTG